MSQVTEPQANHPSREEYVDSLNAQWQLGNDWVVDSGKLLNDAKEKLPHGEWTKMFLPDGTSATKGVVYPGALKYELRVAQMFMSIARHPVLGDTSQSSFLPRSYKTRYTLSRIPADELRRAIERGAVHSGMTGKDAKALLLDDRFPKVQAAIALLRSLSEDYSGSLVDDASERLAKEIFEQLEPEQRQWITSVADVAKWLSAVAGPLQAKWQVEQAARDEDDDIKTSSE